MNRATIHKLTACALLSALATLSFIIEGLFPPLILPGARMGVSNVFILLSALVLGSVYGYATLAIKVILGSLLSGNVTGVLYALPAGLFALTTELLAINFIKKVSVVSVSVLGAVINITAQNVIFCLVTQTTEYLSYVPYLSLIGIIGGLTVGFAVYLIIKILPKKYFAESKNTQETET